MFRAGALRGVPVVTNIWSGCIAGAGALHHNVGMHVAHSEEQSDKLLIAIACGAVVDSAALTSAVSIVGIRKSIGLAYESDSTRDDGGEQRNRSRRVNGEPRD